MRNPQLVLLFVDEFKVPWNEPSTCPKSFDKYYYRISQIFPPSRVFTDGSIRPYDPVLAARSSIGTCTRILPE